MRFPSNIGLTAKFSAPSTNHTHVKIDLSGLVAFVEKVTTQCADVVNDVAHEVESVAKQLAPVSTGFLRDNIQVTKVATPRDPTAVVSSLAPYSEFVERGTVNSDAQPYMDPAMAMGERDLNERLGGLMSGWGAGKPKVSPSFGVDPDYAD